MVEFLVICFIIYTFYSLFKEAGEKMKGSNSKNGSGNSYSSGSAPIYVKPKDMEMAKYQLRCRGVDYTEAGGMLHVNQDRMADAVDSLNMEGIDNDW